MGICWLKVFVSPGEVIFISEVLVWDMGQGILCKWVRT